MEYTVIKDIAYEKNHSIIKVKAGQSVTSVDFPSQRFADGFVKNGSIEEKKATKKATKKVEEVEVKKEVKPNA